MQPEYLNLTEWFLGLSSWPLPIMPFSLAINSMNLPSLATQFNIHLLAPAAAGDELLAEARVLRNGRRVGITEMAVTNQTGKLVAKATGTTIPTEA